MGLQLAVCLGSGIVVVLSVRFFSPKTLVFLASCTGNLGKWHGLVGKKRKQTGELKLILAVLLTGSGITLLACGSLGYEVLSQLVVEFWSFV